MNNKYDELDYIIQFCSCANIRKAARTVTQAFEKQMQSTGLKVTQYYMLVNIARHKEITVSELGEIMLLEQSTATRNINILKNNGYVSITKAKDDLRTKYISITDLGLEKLEEATPIWLNIQTKIEDNLGKDKFNDLIKSLNILQESIE
ncbi:MarR family winged helix-turn-helix transcriptional regulator [Oceanobacillus saliphilus]|uniref:MarR family winged helix-turn-helix transcriptional regulator n=1 Tax=Oceanobacillus saliphilus TaxID=2925834 RepID=UPI00201E4C5E|nr:MarR family winged helix-turn-helix transcriptional regulator [Oceanobacillus saliphilus]